MDTIQLRDSQEKILTYRGGKLGISAVPGSGKTFTLSLLAARIIERSELQPGQEVLVVTLVNSAVDNFYQRVGEFVRNFELIPNLGYRVRTLHGLAHDIVRERPALVGLEENFQIVDEREADSIRNDVARAWLRNHPDALEAYLIEDLSGPKGEQVRKKDLPELAGAIALDLIRYAKDQQLNPEQLRQRLDRSPAPLPLAEMGWEMYADYQRALTYRGAVDFDDLIRLALLALELDGDFLNRLQQRWPYILEDEAQDSSRLQEAILSKLAGPHGNWVRVGDPNQAIYETFTTANPRYLRQFMTRPDVLPRDLPQSGRSTLSIIALANSLVRWSVEEHPVAEIRDALQSDPQIIPTDPGDPQPNPPDDPTAIKLIRQRYTADDEVKAIASSLERYLPEHPQATVAVLVPTNKRGAALVDELIRRKLPYEDGLLKSTSATRFSASRLGDLLKYLADPQSPRKLARVYEIWRRADLQDRELRPLVVRLAELVRKLRHVEDYLWPAAGHDWLAELAETGLADEQLESLVQFRLLVRRWQAAAVLPVDQIVLTVAQDLLSDPGELAIAHKLALLLQNAAGSNPSWRLPDLTIELDVIARNERRFLGFSQDDTGFNPNNYRGQVVIGTLHKAKGLEWDRVYLMSVNNYDFPSAQPGEFTLSDKWFLRDRLNLEAEALAQLQAVLSHDEYEWYEEGEPTRQARLDYARERLRLLYVGITRARKELIITSNTGHDGKKQPALGLLALCDRWDKYLAGN